MDNNSNDTLFGFTAITDMFTENHSDTSNIDPSNQSDDIDDETLEKLKRDSAKNRPATPGSKNKEKEEVEEEDLKDVKEESEEPEESKEEPLNEPEETKDDDDENSSTVTALFDAIAEQLDWEFEEGDKKPSTVEDLVDYFGEVIKENSVPEYANEQVKEIDNFVRNGGKLEDYFNASPTIDYDNFDTTEESNQRHIVGMLLAEKGYNDKQIKRKVDKFEDAGILEDEAEDALEEMKEITEKKKERLLKDQENQRKQFEEDQQNFLNNVAGEIKSMDNIRGIKVPTKDKKALLTYIFKVGPDGRTQYQKDYSSNIKNLIESAYFTMKGDALLDTAKKMGTSSAMTKLKNSLRSTGINKGARRINTSSSSDSIWARAVQQL